MIIDIEDQNFITLWYEFVNHFIIKAETEFLYALEGICHGFIMKTQSESGYTLSFYDIGEGLWFRRIESALKSEVSDFITKFELHMNSRATTIYRLVDETRRYYFGKNLQEVKNLISASMVFQSYN